MKQFINQEEISLSKEAESILPEIRYQAMNHYVLKTGYREILELGCESTRRGIYLVEEKGLHYVGAQASDTIEEYRQEVSGLTSYRIGRLSYCPIDLTSGASVYRAASELKGPIIMITNGILKQYQQGELAVVIENIRNLLRAKGGCWLAGENNLNAGDLNRMYGLSSRQVSYFPEGMQENTLDPAIRKELASCHLYVITAPNGNQDKGNELAMDGGLSYSYEVQGNVGIIHLNGSLDSTTGPSLMDFFKTELCHGEVDRIRINCAKLDYLSSKGIRILQNMDMKMTGGILIAHASQNVRSALNCTSLKIE